MMVQSVIRLIVRQYENRRFFLFCAINSDILLINMTGRKEYDRYVHNEEPC